MPINEQIQRLQQAKEDLKNKLIEKNVAVGDELLISDYPPLLDDIQTGVDTSDATATSEDIRYGKTAYVNDVKVVGAIEDYDGTFEGEAKPDVNPVKIMAEYNKNYPWYLFTGKDELIPYFEEMYDNNETLVIGNPEWAEKSYSTRKTTNYSSGLTHMGIFAWLWTTYLPKIKIYLQTLSGNGVYSSSCGYLCSRMDNVKKLDIEIVQYVYSNTKNSFSLYHAFNGCSKVEEINLIADVEPYDWSSAFADCTKLKTINAKFNNKHPNSRDVDGLTISKDLYSNATCYSMFNYCKALENVKFNSIYRLNVQLGSGTSYGHLLTLESLLSAIQACRTYTSTFTLTVGTANLEKLANVYVKVIDETDTNYYPFEQCESTDEGAMTISDYLALKNWTIA